MQPPRVAEDDPEEPFILHYNQVFTYALRGLQELDAIVQAQQSVIADLQTRVATLEST